MILKSWERHKIRSPNVLAMVARYNNVMKWVSACVLGERERGKGRLKVVPRFIRIAEHLRNLNNFFSLSAMYPDHIFVFFFRSYCLFLFDVVPVIQASQAMQCTTISKASR